jgi:hypothetical protein
MLHANPMHRQGVQEFVGKHATHNRIRQHIANFDNPVAQVRRGRQHIVAELAAMSAELDDLKFGRVAEFVAPFQKLLREQFAKQRSNADAGEVVAFLADALPSPV